MKILDETMKLIIKEEKNASIIISEPDSIFFCFCF